MVNPACLAYFIRARVIVPFFWNSPRVDDTFFLKKKSDNTTSVLPRFRSMWWSENEVQGTFNPKTHFQPVCFIPKTPIKYLRNHDKSIHGLKKPSKKPNLCKTKNQPELRYVFSRTLKEQKHLIWTPLIK